MAITTLDNGFVFVPRQDWGARHRAGSARMRQGITEINIHHTVTTVRKDPCLNMRIIEDVLNNRRPRLTPGYSFCADPSGVILEGAGNMVGAHTRDRNSTSYGIALIGNYNQMQPTLLQLVNIARTINLLRMTGAVEGDPSKIRILGHRDHQATACPGNNVYNRNLNGMSAIQWIHHFMVQGV